MQSMQRALSPAKSADAPVACKCLELPRVLPLNFLCPLRPHYCTRPDAFRVKKSERVFKALTNWDK